MIRFPCKRSLQTQMQVIRFMWCQTRHPNTYLNYGETETSYSVCLGKKKTCKMSTRKQLINVIGLRSHASLIC